MARDPARTDIIIVRQARQRRAEQWDDKSVRRPLLRHIELALPRNYAARSVDARSQVRECWRALGVPPVFIRAHPLNADRLSARTREKRRVSRGVLVTVAPIASRSFDEDAADVVERQIEHTSQL